VTDPRAPRAFFEGDARTIARRMLGQRLVRVLDDGTRLAGLIVEVEAYLGARDRASHTWNNRRTRRNEVMHGPAGHAYVYFTYGLHHCLNVVVGRSAAVLIRALAPAEGADRMRALRQGRLELASGPARLTQALAIDLTLNGEDLERSARLWIEVARPPGSRLRITTSARVGVEYAGAWASKPLRCFLAGHPDVSPGRPSGPKPNGRTGVRTARGA
jgi:DNA-3-methyladenine glycosylase